MGSFDFQSAPNRQQKLDISGVAVSVHADLLVHGKSRAKNIYGAALFRMTQDDAVTDAAKAKRKDMGLYVAALLSIHAKSSLGDGTRDIANKLCMSIDIQHGEVFAASNSNTRRVNDLNNACAMISAIWPSV